MPIGSLLPDRRYRSPLLGSPLLLHRRAARAGSTPTLPPPTTWESVAAGGAGAGGSAGAGAGAAVGGKRERTTHRAR